MMMMEETVPSVMPEAQLELFLLLLLAIAAASSTVALGRSALLQWHPVKYDYSSLITSNRWFLGFVAAVQLYRLQPRLVDLGFLHLFQLPWAVCSPCIFIAMQQYVDKHLATIEMGKDPSHGPKVKDNCMYNGNYLLYFFMTVPGFYAIYYAGTATSDGHTLASMMFFLLELVMANMWLWLWTNLRKENAELARMKVLHKAADAFFVQLEEATFSLSVLEVSGDDGLLCGNYVKNPSLFTSPSDPVWTKLSDPRLHLYHVSAQFLGRSLRAQTLVQKQKWAIGTTDKMLQRKLCMSVRRRYTSARVRFGKSSGVRHVEDRSNRPSPIGEIGLLTVSLALVQAMQMICRSNKFAALSGIASRQFVGRRVCAFLRTTSRANLNQSRRLPSMFLFRSIRTNEAARSLVLGDNSDGQPLRFVVALNLYL